MFVSTSFNPGEQLILTKFRFRKDLWIFWGRHCEKKDSLRSTKVTRNNPPEILQSSCFVRRNGQSTDRNCWCQLASICVVWYIAQDNITVRPALSQRDCAGWFHGWCRQRYSGKSWYVVSALQPVPGFKLSNCSGDVQSPDARPIRCEDGSTFESSSKGDVDTVGLPEGCHARILGEELYLLVNDLC